jgi:pimeloyl-ACP methyl ester carboxylesterase
MAKHPMRDVVVLLPGILGSVLSRDGKEVWAPSGGAIRRALFSLLGSVKDLALHDDPVDVDDLGDGVKATRLMPDVHLIPGFWGIDAYSDLSRWIVDTFDVVPGRTFLPFPYDWRRDNRVAARQLRQTVDPILADVRRDDPDAKLVLIGHSMGGLVARSFLEHYDGWRDTRMLVTFGTPYRGAMNALNFVANGFVKKIALFKVADLSGLLRSLTSVYQLLPIFPCVDVGTGDLQHVTKVDGVPFLDASRASAAREFHESIQRSIDARGPGSYAIWPVVGIDQTTGTTARFSAGAVTVLQTYDGNDLGGDSTVPRPSATPIELGDQPNAMYVVEKHGSLQNAQGVREHLLGLLTQVPDLGSFRDARAGLRLEIDDLFAADEPVALSVQARARNLDLVAEVVDSATGAPVAPPARLTRGADERHTLELAPLPEGSYRVTVHGGGSSEPLAQPVTGLFLVLRDSDDPDLPPAGATAGRSGVGPARPVA